MKMKKILKMIGLVILIVLVVVMADLVRKTIIVSKIEKMCNNMTVHPIIMKKENLMKV